MAAHLIMDGDNVMKELREPLARPLTTVSNPPLVAEPEVPSPAPTSSGLLSAAHEPQIWHAGLDQPFHQAIARMSGGLSPLALGQTYGDRIQHLLLSPDKQIKLLQRSGESWRRFFAAAGSATQQRIETTHDPYSFVVRRMVAAPGDGRVADKGLAAIADAPGTYVLQP